MAVIFGKKKKKAQPLVWEKALTLQARNREEDGNAQYSPQPPLNQLRARDLGIHCYCRGTTWETVRCDSFQLSGKAGV